MRDGARRRPGRPSLDGRDPSVSVHLRLPARVYLDLARRAQVAGCSVPERLRRDLVPLRYRK